jgi:hypothetical protein
MCDTPKDRVMGMQSCGMEEGSWASLSLMLPSHNLDTRLSPHSDIVTYLGCIEL